MTAYWSRQSPLGPITIEENGEAITRVFFGDVTSDQGLRRESTLLLQAFAQIHAYFEGRIRAFSLPLAPAGTPFSLKVWAAMQEIPYGRTASYKDVAQVVGSPRAYRAVGLAANRNPIAIIIPCHRVVGANGSLTGYNGGLAFKQYLLQLESGQ